MDIKQLNYLNTLYVTRSFTKAASQHFISQPNITTSIKKLEEELNCKLIDRDTRPLRFTEEGEFFMPYVKNILLSVNEGRAALDQFLKKSIPKLNVCISSSIGNGLLPLLYTDFVNQYPGLEFLSVDLTMQMILDFLWKEDIDFAYTIIPAEIDLERYQVTLLQKSELCLLLHKENPLSIKESISFDMLKEERIITFPDGSLILKRLLNSATLENAKLNIHKVAQIYVMEELVKENYGIATIIQNAFNAGRIYDDFVVKSFQQPIYFEEGFIVKKGKKLSRQVESFREFVMKEAESKKELLS